MIYNIPLIEDRLALRVSALKYDRRFDQEEAFIDTKRAYVTVMFKPWKKASLSLHTESIDIDNRRPVRSVPFDNITTFYESNDLLNQAGLVDANNPVIPDATLFANDPNWINGSRVLTRNQNALLDIYGNRITLVGGTTDTRSFFGSVHSANVSLNAALGIYEPVNRSSNGTTLLNNNYFPLK